MMTLKQRIYSRVYEQHWTLGFIEDSLIDIVDGKPPVIHYVKDIPRDRWFADPFILDYDDTVIHVLAEEFCYNIHRGRIAKLTIDRHLFRLLDYGIVLDLSTHLSFPFIIRKNGKVFIAPENSESGSWSLYEYDFATDYLKKEGILVNKPLTDAIMTNFFGEELVFSTHIPTQNGNILYLYSPEGILLKTLPLSSNTARNAGDWFIIDNTVYRPAQDCNDDYGKAVIIQEVKQSGDGFTFTDVCRITSTHPRFTTGCHTFNNYKDLTVLDVHGYRRPNLVGIVNTVKRLLR